MYLEIEHKKKIIRSINYTAVTKSQQDPSQAKSGRHRARCTR